MRASGAYKNCKPCAGSPKDGGNRNYADSDAGSVSARLHCAYRRTGSSNSTPRMWGKEMEARLRGLSSGEGTPASVSGRTESIVFMEEDEPKEWEAQVEPGVHITFVSLPRGGNDLKRIRFRYFLLFSIDVIFFKILIFFFLSMIRSLRRCGSEIMVELLSYCPLWLDFSILVELLVL